MMIRREEAALMVFSAFRRRTLLKPQPERAAHRHTHSTYSLTHLLHAPSSSLFLNQLLLFASIPPSFFYLSSSKSFVFQQRDCAQSFQYGYEPPDRVSGLPKTNQLCLVQVCVCSFADQQYRAINSQRFNLISKSDIRYGSSTLCLMDSSF